MILPDNCSFAVLPPKPFDLLSIERSNCCRSRLVGTEEPLCRSRGAEDEAYREHEAYKFFATNTTDSQPPIGWEAVGTDSVRYRRPDRPRLGRPLF